MKLVRFVSDNGIHPGLWQEDGIVDLRALFPDIPDVGGRFFEEGWLERLSVEQVGKTAGAVVPKARLSFPVASPSKIICLGKNYVEHAREGGFEAPVRPLLFAKAPSALNGPYDAIVLPRSSKDVDWEVELAVVIRKRCKRVSKADAMDVVAGLTIMNDVSARQAQFADSQWFRGKSFDTFAPMGPFLVTLDEIEDIGNLRLETLVNGVTMQDGSTRDLIFDIPTLIENISEDMTLLPGDIVSTGTPAGVGFFRNPPVVLQAGDVVECRISGLGALINPVVNDTAIQM
ncbi:MAG: fumarylacetoacetate hydrolase family protein [Thermodesulfobacteriota bacterium]